MAVAALHNLVAIDLKKGGVIPLTRGAALWRHAV